MTRQTHPNRTLIVGTLLLALCLSVAPARGAQSAANDPFTLVPAESLFCVRINNLSGTLGKVDQFLTGISPIGVSMLAPAQLGKMLGSAEAKGINMSGTFAIFGPLPGGDAPDPTRIGVLVPISDYDQFVQGNPNVGPPDAQGISQIGEGGQAFATIKVGSYALATLLGNRQALVETKNLVSAAGATGLAKRLGPDELKDATSAPVWAYVNIQVVAKMFGPLIQAKLQEAKAGLKEMGQAGPPMMAQAGTFMDMYGTMLNTLMQQTQFISLSLDPSAGAIRLASVMAAMPNTEMAQIFTGDSATADRKFLQYLENGALMNIVGRVDAASWSKINELSLNLLGTVMGQDASSEEMSKLKKMAKDATACFSGTLATSFTMDPKSKPPFQLQYVIGVKDAPTLYRMMDEATAMLNSGPIAEFYKNMGLKLAFTLNRKAETYKGVAIDSIQFSAKSIDPNSPANQMITAMYGEGLEGRMAVVDDLLVYTMGTRSGPMVQALIDKVKGASAQPAPSEVQSAMQLIPGAEKADFFGTYNYLRAIQMATSIMPMPMPQMDVPSQSNVAMAGDTDDGKMKIEIAIPKQHVLEIMMAVMKMQQQGMQQGMQQQ